MTTDNSDLSASKLFGYRLKEKNALAHVEKHKNTWLNLCIGTAKQSRELITCFVHTLWSCLLKELPEKCLVQAYWFGVAESHVLCETVSKRAGKSVVLSFTRGKKSRADRRWSLSIKQANFALVFAFGQSWMPFFSLLLHLKGHGIVYFHQK